MEKHKYHYFYRITNQVNGKYYYGIHSTNDLNDGYLGSGTHLREDKRKYGKENFKKEILKFFPTRKDASEYEKKIVTEELVHDNNCYNIKMGGDYGTTAGTILVVDKNDVMHRCTAEDERYISGEWVPFGTGKISCYDTLLQKNVHIFKTEYLNNRNRYITLNHGHLPVKDKYGNIYYVNKEDERYKNMELIPLWKGMKHSEETKEKLHEIYLKNKHQQGDKNSHFGTCWVTKDGVNKSIKKDELDEYILSGWSKGRNVIPTEKFFKAQSKLDKKIIEEKLTNGQTKRSIAREYNIDKGTLYRFIKRIGIKV